MFGHLMKQWIFDKDFATSTYRSSLFTDHCYKGFHFCDQAKIHQFCSIRLDQHWWYSKHLGSKNRAMSTIKCEVMILELCIFLWSKKKGSFRILNVKHFRRWVTLSFCERLSTFTGVLIQKNSSPTSVLQGKYYWNVFLYHLKYAEKRLPLPF